MRNFPAGFRLASPRYFQTMGMPLVAGRDFSGRDQYDAAFVAIIGKTKAITHLLSCVLPAGTPRGYRAALHRRLERKRTASTDALSSPVSSVPN